MSQVHRRKDDKTTYKISVGAAWSVLIVIVGALVWLTAQLQSAENNSKKYTDERRAEIMAQIEVNQQETNKKIDNMARLMEKNTDMIVDEIKRGRDRDRRRN